MKVLETSAAEVYAHALDHGDRPVIHGAEIDYDDIHDGVHYHADLLKPAGEALTAALRAEDRTASSLAIRVDLAVADGTDPREWPSFDEALADYRAAVQASTEACDRVTALRARVDQEAAFATYGVPA